MDYRIILISVFTIITANNVEAREAWINPTNYNVISDEYSEAVPEGACLIVGRAYVSGTSSGIADAKISTLDKLRSTKTDSSGYYKLGVSSSDTSIFFFHQAYDEIVIWNYQFKSKHIVTIDFFPKDPANTVPVVSFKPVIYMYSEEELTVSLKMSYLGDLTFTYPSYNDGWNVKVNHNGIQDLAGIQYPYLFWEGEIESLSYTTINSSLVGNFIDTDTSITFLERTMCSLGLNYKESADFISFWGPRLVKSEYAFIQFFVDDDYSSKISTIDVHPSPDYCKRIYMLFTLFDNHPSGLEYNKQFFKNKEERKGFSLIEWGGSELNPKLPH